jgi:hypothetical protein
MPIAKPILTAVFLLLGAGAACASPNLVTNGSFEQSPFSANSQFGSAGYANLPGWSVAANSSTPFDLWFQAGTSTTVSAQTQYGANSQDLVPSFNDTAPDGHAFVTLDGDPNATGVLSQSLSNLKAGDAYTLSFSWAATQMNTGSHSNYNIALAYNLGATALTSSTGGQSTAVFNETYGQSTGWMTVTASFIATSAQEVLSFLSYGGPVGGPPIAALDNISLVDAGTPVPEPSSIALFAGVALLGMIFAQRRA